MYCPSCGEEIPDDSAFCRHCGISLTEDTRPESEEATQVQSDEEEETGWDITLGKLVAYPVGIILIILGLAALAESVIAAILFLAGGVIALPIVRSKLAKSRGISVGRWATVAIVIVAFFAGGVVIGASESGGPDQPGEDNVGESEVQLIEKPATDLVIQLDQFGAGWTGGVDGNETYANGRYFHSGEDAVLDTTAEKHDTAEEASTKYEARVAEIQESHSTDSVRLGDEGVLYVTGNSAWVYFRDANVIAQVRYTEQYAPPRKSEVQDFAELMHGNFRD